jgi:hypothetical protein
MVDMPPSSYQGGYLKFNAGIVKHMNIIGT